MRELQKTDLPSKISGEIYRQGDRPKDSQKEDVVVIHTAGLAGQTQRGVLTIHLFVPEPDWGRRVGELEVQLAKAIFELPPLPAFKWEMEEVPSSMRLSEVGQELIHTRVRYRVFNG